MSPFLELLYNLSHETGLKLYPDKNSACKLVITDNIHIQLETDISQQKLLLGCLICEIPPGTFREEVLKHAMAENFEAFPMFGTLCYIQQKNSLALYDYLPLQNLKVDYLIDYITVFADKAESWRQSILDNKPGPNALDTFPKDKPPSFGIKT